MARTENPYPDPSEDASLGEDEDISRIKELLGGQEKKEKPLRWQRPDPQENKYQPLLDRIMKEVEGQSQSPEEFTEKFHRVIDAMKSKGMVIDNPDEQLQTYLQRWNKAREPMVMPEVNPQTQEELDGMERDKRMQGLGHGPGGMP